MDKANIKEQIKIEAIKLFSEKGFHGTSIRDIATAANCSLPMLYYYFNNKNDLFEEIAYNEFLALIEKLNQSISPDLPLEEIYYQAIKQRKELTDKEKAIYKLANKVWLGFEGNQEIREKLRNWENSRYERNKKILFKYYQDNEMLDIYTSIILGVFQNITEKIILFDEDISDAMIHKQINFLLHSFK